jgi:hypothetical protein
MKQFFTPQKKDPAVTSSFLKRSLSFITSALGSTKFPALSKVTEGSPTKRAAELADL